MNRSRNKIMDERSAYRLLIDELGEHDRFGNLTLMEMNMVMEALWNHVARMEKDGEVKYASIEGNRLYQI